VEALEALCYWWTCSRPACGWLYWQCINSKTIQIVYKLKSVSYSLICVPDQCLDFGSGYDNYKLK